MTKKQKDKILEIMKDRNYCKKRIAEEQDKIIDANYMFEDFLDILRIAVERQEVSEIIDTNEDGAAAVGV